LGHTYQVNYTYKERFRFQGSPAGLYSDLRKKQSVPYSAFINVDPYYIISFSPELFFRKQGDRMTVQPMKGTSARGRYLLEDRTQIERLKKDSKNRSENLMIVDLLRNDLGKISQVGSVRVERLFEVIKYPTLLQMTSTITSQLAPNVEFSEIFRSLFPSGSVTGAPKIRTMELIRELEPEPRGIYTGSIGYITPEKTAVFNVAIRTVVIDRSKNCAELGIGSGIVYDSDPFSEKQECQMKAKFLTTAVVEFDLIETMLWTPDGDYFLLDLHLRRLSSSAAYFGFRYQQNSIRARLGELKRCFCAKPYRARLRLAKDGEIEITYAELEPLEGELKVLFSPWVTSSSDVFLFHKTTERQVYEQELAR
ncbi:MAG: aminodeoxychorismate synthase component I, partial [bacterium]|nr:aminodeoxychorismate synthase component I [bacterium]